MKKILLLVLLVFTLVVAGCSTGDSATEDQNNESQIEQPVASDNDKIEDMLEGKYNGKTISITGEVLLYDYDKDMNLTTIQVYPTPGDTSIVAVAYKEGKMEKEPDEGDMVYIKGISNGGVQIPIPDARVLGLIAESVEIIK